MSKRLIHRCFALAAATFVLTGIANAAAPCPHQWVRADANGNIQGRAVVAGQDSVSAVRRATVSLLGRGNLPVIEPTLSDQSGRFQLSGVRPGVYALIVRGDAAISCSALHVVSSDIPLPTSFELTAGEIDYRTIRSAMMRYAPTTAPAVEFDPTINPWADQSGEATSAFHVNQSNGGLSGKIGRAGTGESLGDSNANVLVYQNGLEVARTTTDSEGEFYFPNLPSGNYCVIGAGQSGFGVAGVRLIGSSATDSAQTTSNDDTTLVSLVQGASGGFVMQLAPITSGGAPDTTEPYVEDEIVMDVPPGAIADSGLAGYGPGGSGGFGGGGGGYGSGGLGGLGALAVAGALAYAIADNNDNNNAIVLPPPTSPSIPVVVSP